MSNDMEILVRLFAENPLAEIRNNMDSLIKKYFDKDWKITQEPWYPQAYDLLFGQKSKLETTIAKLAVPDEREAVRVCLVDCWRMANFNNYEPSIFQYQMDVYIKLIQYHFQGKWTTTQIDYFKKVANILGSYNNYFISYTNHYPQHINEKFQPVINSVLRKGDYSPEDLSGKNLLAAALNKYLNIRNLRKGFFDKESMRVSEMISERVRQNAGMSIALVQLLSKASFEFAGTNWCYDEFNNYKEGRKIFLNGNEYPAGFAPLPFFIIIEENPFPDEELTPDGYDDWIKEIKERVHCDLTATPGYDEFTRAVDRLINNINAYRCQMIQNVP